MAAALTKIPQTSTDILLTAFRSFTQDHTGRPLANPTALIAEGATERLLTSPGPSWLPTLGAGRIGPYKCITVTANTDYNSPGLFAEACRLIRPKLVLSIGLGGATIVETGATNRLHNGRPVFDAHGQRIDSMKPVSAELAADEAIDRVLPLRWGNRIPRLKSVVQSSWSAGDSPFGAVTIASSARPDNDYICNATAWIFARLLSCPVSLPWIGTKGGTPDLVIPSMAGQKTAAGFVHFAPVTPGHGGYVQAALALLTDIAS